MKASRHGRFRKNRAPGRSTDTLPDADALHIPLVTGDRAEGVLTVRLDRPPTLEQRELLDAFAAQLALFVNKERALEESRDRAGGASIAEITESTFRFRLARIEDATGRDVGARCNSQQPDRAELQQAVRRLTRTVDHLLDATRLESGLLQPVREWCEPADLLREAVAAAGLNDRRRPNQRRQKFADHFVDSRLIQQALGALLSNAVGHGNLPIDRVSAARDDSMLIISVADHGPGLAPGEENKVFEKFYRGPRTRPGGLGLGLSIARQLIEAHSGEIVAQNREGGGARFSIRLPLGEPMRLPSEATA